jgi:L-lactate dehydrogenase complex protein LldG
MVEVARVSSARDEILGRVRRALTVRDGVEVPRAYRRISHEPRATIVERFCERVADYEATVQRVDSVAAAVAELCNAHGIDRLVTPADLPDEWTPDEVELVLDDGLDNAALDRIGAALTGCSLAIAETGTLVLDGGPRQGRRALSLVPDYHLCVVEEAQIVAGVPEAIERIAAPIREERRPVTFVSGSSATSDIELVRVGGVHGPRTLDVLVVAAA